MTPPPTDPTRRQFIRRSILFGTLFVTCFACLLPEFILAAIQVAGHCAAGAIRFTVGGLEQIQADQMGATISLVAFVAVILGTQLAISRSRVRLAWTMDHSIRAVIGVVCIVATGLCVAGLINTLVWNATSPSPWFRISLTRDANYRTIMSNNLKQIGVALQNYHENFQAFPAGGTFRSSGTAGHGWMVQLLPFTDQSSLYGRVRFEVPWYHRINREVYESRVSAFEDPMSQPGMRPARNFAPAYFAANDRVMNSNLGLSISEITDGSSNTILAGSLKTRPRAWGDVANWRKLDFGINKSIDGFGSFEPGGAFFLMADGSVRFINEDADLRMLRAMATPNADDTIWEY